MTKKANYLVRPLPYSRDFTTITDYVFLGALTYLLRAQPVAGPSSHPHLIDTPEDLESALAYLAKIAIEAERTFSQGISSETQLASSRDLYVTLLLRLSIHT